MPESAANLPRGFRLYRGAATLAGAVGWPWFYWRLRSRGFGESFRPRLGLDLPILPACPGQQKIWLHGVSVGEIAGAEPLVRELERLAPKTCLYLSTGTETGQAVARRLYAPSHPVFYYPLDLPWTVRRYLDHIRPSVYVALETEIWPNFLLAAKKRGVKLVLLNGRLTEKSLRGYLKFNTYLKYIINIFDIIAASSAEDARRFAALGADPAKVAVTGNTKFERRSNPAAQAQAADFRERLAFQGAPVMLAASTHPGEEEIVLTAYQALRRPYPALHLLLAPRHPERAPAVAHLLHEAGIPCQFWRALKNGEGRREAAVIIDTVGDLFALYSLADVIFVGGSLIPHGGQNILEPAAWGKVPLYGPHLANFRAARQLLEEAAAGIEVTDVPSLIRAGRYCLEQPEEIYRRGQAGLAALNTHQGAAARQAKLLLGLLAGDDAAYEGNMGLVNEKGIFS
ncbi:MAG: 3-deoxy-D-manno-octulosonic acid transferase [Deltaproteobacteria bacterium]|nr:3-deoxy-D-manno-octulosonic acid transferase [Deltaproteobacteria bacterium]